MRSLTVEQFINEIEMDLEDNIYEPVVGIGKSGVGKTMSIYELTQKLGIGFCELRLVTLLETDLLGIPDINEHGRTTWASNDLLPLVERDGEEGILVLDEITSATSTIRAACYQLMDSKRALGNYKLPDKWKVVALGNGPDDGGVYSGMEAAFLNRSLSYRIEPELGSWKKWAIAKGVNPSVVAFLTFQPEYLHKFDPDEMVSVFPSPRSWTALSEKLNRRERRTGVGKLHIGDVETWAAGYVGEESAPLFGAFYAYNKQVINTEDIMSGKASSDVRNMETEVMHLVIQGLIKEIAEELRKGKKGGYANYEESTVKRVANAFKWTIGISKYKADYAIMIFQDVAASVPELVEMATDDRFDKYCPEFLDYVQEVGIILQPAQ